jgi:5-methyltetrahydropteroyltriglutamate--homocysteine methyltransferase
MSRSADRILTTHTGSLPRPDDLIRIMWAKGDGVPVDERALDARVASAVQEVVDRQAAAGIDIVNDGEMSKPSYATYVKDRLHGFGGDSVQDYFFADLVDFPKSAERVAGDPGRRKRSAPACNAPISVKDAGRRAGHGQPRRRRHGRRRPTIFSSAASPGVVTLFFANQHYPISTKPTCSPSPRPCATSTRPSPPPASPCRSTAPTSPWAAT